MIRLLNRLLMRAGHAVQPPADQFLKRQEQSCAEDQEGNEANERALAGVQKENCSRRAPDQRGNRQQEQPSTDLCQIAAETHCAGERSGPQRDRIRSVGQDRIAAHPHQRGKRDQRAAAGDGVDQAGRERCGRNDDQRSPSTTYRSLIVRSASYA